MGTIRTELFEHVVGRFFEAAAVPELWPDALHDLAQACGASGATALPVTGVAAVVPIASRDIVHLVDDGLRTGWFAPERNSRMARSMALVKRGWRGIITEQDAFTPEHLACDPFQHEYIRPNGHSSYAGAVIAQAPGLILPVSVERSIAQGPYMRDEISLMNQLFLHLRAAGDLAARIGMASAQRTADAFSATGHPIALIGRDGCIIQMNARFERLVGDGVHVKADRLGSWRSDADRAITAAIDRALRYDGTLQQPLASVVLPRPHGLRPLVAQVVPIVGRAHDFMNMVGAIVTLTDLEAARSSPAEAVLQQAFGLTPAEARLAAGIAAGQTLAEVGLKEGCTRETLRSRLKAVFNKTGTGRQAELVLLLSKIASP